jgi:hypothetical protein
MLGLRQREDEFMRSQRLSVVAAVLVLCGGVSHAVEFADGAKELVLDFSYVDTDDVGKSTDLSGALGFFVPPHNEVGPVLSYFKSDPDVGSSFDATALGGFYRFNFGTGSEHLSPFVGGSVLWIGGDAGDFFDYETRVEVGTRVMAGKRGAIAIGLFYDKLYGATGVSDQDSVGLSAGLSIFFGNE